MENRENYSIFGINTGRGKNPSVKEDQDSLSFFGRILGRKGYIA